MTPSLANFLYSLIFGAVVLGGLGAFFFFASQNDRIQRRGD